MVAAHTIRFAAGIIGNVTAFFLFLSPIPTFYTIWKKKGVEQYSAIPYLAAFVNCMLWVLYGLPFVHPNSTLVITTNGAGLVIEFLYLLVFVIYSDNKQRLRVVVVVAMEIVAVATIAACALYLLHTTAGRSFVVGIISIIFNIVMYASPLVVMKTVITTKSVEYMPLSLSVAALANSISWSIYALFPFDPFIANRKYFSPSTYRSANTCRYFRT